MSVEITVQGTFTAYQPPQRATVRLRVGFEGPKKATVFTGVSTAADAVSSSLVALLNPSAGPVTWWSSDQLRTWADRPWNSEGKQLPLVFHARAGSQAKFADFGALSEWLGRVVDAAGVSIEGIDWTLTEASTKELTAQVRSAAVQAAKTKAAAYAEALGLRRATGAGHRRCRDARRGTASQQRAAGRLRQGAQGRRCWCRPGLRTAGCRGERHCRRPLHRRLTVGSGAGQGAPAACCACCHRWRYYSGCSCRSRIQPEPRRGVAFPQMWWPVGRTGAPAGSFATWLRLLRVWPPAVILDRPGRPHRGMSVRGGPRTYFRWQSVGSGPRRS